MWIAYRNKHGAVATGPRLELQLANLQAMVSNALGGKAAARDFIPGMSKQSTDGVEFNQVVSAFESMGLIDNGNS